VATERQAVVVDTNILFSALLRDRSGFAEALLNSGRRFFICEQALVEIFRRKEKLAKLSQLSEDDIAKLYLALLRQISLHKEDLITRGNWAKAYALCRDIDETDTPHVALTLELDGLLWTGDKKLKDGLRLKGFDQFFQPA
jgi:predicted nucleic acid-binding protein